MEDPFVNSDENKKILYFDANNLYCHSLSRPLLYGEVESFYGRWDLFVNKSEKMLTNPVDSNNGYFLEVDLRYPDNWTKKWRMFKFVQRIRKFLLINILILWTW